MARSWRGGSGELALDLAGAVGLEHVTVLDVGEVAQDDAAVESGRDLADVVVEAPQARDLAVVYHRAVTHEAHARAPRDPALEDVRARDRAHARGAENLPYPGAAQRF